MDVQPRVHTIDRVAWWSEIYADFETAGGDGSAFWWYQDREIGGKFDVSQGDPELDVPPCRVNYQLADGGAIFNSDVTIHHTSSTTVDGWEVSFTFPGGQSITQIWNAAHVQDGRSVTVVHPSDYNTSIDPGAAVNFGFSGAS